MVQYFSYPHFEMDEGEQFRVRDIVAEIYKKKLNIENTCIHNNK